jgi:hypothetical protein
MVAKLVKNTAKEMAGAFYEGNDMLRDGRVERSTLFRIKARTQAEFVSTYWKDFVVVARQKLAELLTMPGISQTDKDKIYDALLQERGAWTDEQIAAPSIVRMN